MKSIMVAWLFFGLVPIKVAIPLYLLMVLGFATPMMVVNPGPPPPPVMLDDAQVAPPVENGQEDQ